MGSISAKGRLVFEGTPGIQSCPQIKRFEMDLYWAATYGKGATQRST
jgi:hypothetical protein